MPRQCVAYTKTYMRVVEPNRVQTRKVKKAKHNRMRRFIAMVIIFVVALFGVFTFFMNNESEQANTVQNNSPAPIEIDDEENDDSENVPEESLSGEFRQFSGNEFRLLYDNLLQPNLDRVDAPPVISGNDIADARIRQIAEARGYKLRSSPSGSLVSVDGYLLQEAVKQPWEELQAAGNAAGYVMSIVSGYRSVENQRQLFLSRLSAQGVTIQDVANGNGDEAVNTVLITSSIPGYSKHHTGYTIDIECAGYIFELFKESPCYGWMSANNYENAKRFGFIPSYPADADLQGPDPEAWEYVWVGEDLLRN